MYKSNKVGQSFLCKEKVSEEQVENVLKKVGFLPENINKVDPVSKKTRSDKNVNHQRSIDFIFCAFEALKILLSGEEEYQNEMAVHNVMVPFKRHLKSLRKNVFKLDFTLKTRLLQSIHDVCSFLADQIKTFHHSANSCITKFLRYLITWKTDAMLFRRCHEPSKLKRTKLMKHLNFIHDTYPELTIDALLYCETLQSTVPNPTALVPLCKFLCIQYLDNPHIELRPEDRLKLYLLIKFLWDLSVPWQDFKFQRIPVNFVRWAMHNTPLDIQEEIGFEDLIMKLNKPLVLRILKILKKARGVIFDGNKAGPCNHKPHHKKKTKKMTSASLLTSSSKAVPEKEISEERNLSLIYSLLEGKLTKVKRIKKKSTSLTSPIKFKSLNKLSKGEKSAITSSQTKTKLSHKADPFKTKPHPENQTEETTGVALLSSFSKDLPENEIPEEKNSSTSSFPEGKLTKVKRIKKKSTSPTSPIKSKSLNKLSKRKKSAITSSQTETKLSHKARPCPTRLHSENRTEETTSVTPLNSSSEDVLDNEISEDRDSGPTSSIPEGKLRKIKRIKKKSSSLTSPIKSKSLNKLSKEKKSPITSSQAETKLSPKKTVSKIKCAFKSSPTISGSNDEFPKKKKSPIVSSPPKSLISSKNNKNQPESSTLHKSKRLKKDEHDSISLPSLAQPRYDNECYKEGKAPPTSLPQPAVCVQINTNQSQPLPELAVKKQRENPRKQRSAQESNESVETKENPTTQITTKNVAREGETVVDVSDFKPNQNDDSDLEIEKIVCTKVKSEISDEMDEASGSDGDIIPCDENKMMFTDEETATYHRYLKQANLEEKGKEIVSKESVLAFKYGSLAKMRDETVESLTVGSMLTSKNGIHSDDKAYKTHSESIKSISEATLYENSDNEDIDSILDTIKKDRESLDSKIIKESRSIYKGHSKKVEMKENPTTQITTKNVAREGETVLDVALDFKPHENDDSDSDLEMEKMVPAEIKSESSDEIDEASGSDGDILCDENKMMFTDKVTATYNSYLKQANLKEKGKEIVSKESVLAFKYGSLAKIRDETVQSITAGSMLASKNGIHSDDKAYKTHSEPIKSVSEATLYENSDNEDIDSIFDTIKKDLESVDSKIKESRSIYKGHSKKMSKHSPETELSASNQEKVKAVELENQMSKDTSTCVVSDEDDCIVELIKSVQETTTTKGTSSPNSSLDSSISERENMSLHTNKNFSQEVVTESYKETSTKNNNSCPEETATPILLNGESPSHRTSPVAERTEGNHHQTSTPHLINKVVTSKPSLAKPVSFLTPKKNLVQKKGVSLEKTSNCAREMATILSPLKVSSAALSSEISISPNVLDEENKPKEQVTVEPQALLKDDSLLFESVNQESISSNPLLISPNNSIISSCPTKTGIPSFRRDSKLPKSLNLEEKQLSENDGMHIDNIQSLRSSSILSQTKSKSSRKRRQRDDNQTDDCKFILYLSPSPSPTSLSPRTSPLCQDCPSQRKRSVSITQADSSPLKTLRYEDTSSEIFPALKVVSPKILLIDISSSPANEMPKRILQNEIGTKISSTSNVKTSETAFSKICMDQKVLSSEAAMLDMQGEKEMCRQISSTVKSDCLVRCLGQVSSPIQQSSPSRILRNKVINSSNGTSSAFFATSSVDESSPSRILRNKKVINSSKADVEMIKTRLNGTSSVNKSSPSRILRNKKVINSSKADVEMIKTTLNGTSSVNKSSPSRILRNKKVINSSKADVEMIKTTLNGTSSVNKSSPSRILRNKKVINSSKADVEMIKTALNGTSSVNESSASRIRRNKKVINSKADVEMIKTTLNGTSSVTKSSPSRILRNKKVINSLKADVEMIKTTLNGTSSVNESSASRIRRNKKVINSSKANVEMIKTTLNGTSSASNATSSVSESSPLSFLTNNEDVRNISSKSDTSKNEISALKTASSKTVLLDTQEEAEVNDKVFFSPVTRHSSLKRLSQVSPTKKVSLIISTNVKFAKDTEEVINLVSPSEFPSRRNLMTSVGNLTPPLRRSKRLSDISVKPDAVTIAGISTPPTRSQRISSIREDFPDSGITIGNMPPIRRSRRISEMHQRP